MAGLKLLLFATAFAAAAMAAGQCQITVTSLRPCDETGAPATPSLGDPVYGMRVDWTVRGHATGGYNVKFTMADASWVWKNVNATEPGAYYGFTRFPMPLDGTIPMSAVVDCDHQAGNTTPQTASKSGEFVPSPPASLIEYYGTKTWTATQTMAVDIPADGRIDSISYMFGVPKTETFQRVLDDPGVPGMTLISTRPNGYDLYRRQVRSPKAEETVLTHTFDVQSSNVRGDLAKGMGAWAKYASLPAEAARYLRPEKTIQCGDSRVREFVRSVLPANYRRTLTPYQAARKLFVAVAAKLTYETPAHSDAVDALTLCKGDCGTFASLYVASLRSIGIPARVVSGWRAGKDQWHAWSEVYIPGAGWMPQDPTDCQTMWKYRHSSDHFAYFFAVIPDLNSRVVVSRGSTFTTEEGSWQTMQPGQWGVWGPDVRKFPTWITHCSLVAK